MSSIENLRIQGIRSFGPEEKDVQEITFCKPITLILGNNGTGKTTIIECLRNATTGALPPGTGNNRGFVHDPKLAGKPEVNGQVKLKFIDVAGNTCNFSRDYRRLDGKGKDIPLTSNTTLERHKPNGETQTSTLKSSKEMSSSLGISKAVLDRVIFCHQEDSNWPLDTGSVLQQTFDSIFDSTRYTVCLKQIKDASAKQEESIKEGIKDLINLEQIKDQAKELQEDQKKLESKLEASKKTVEKTMSDLKPLEAIITDISSKIKEVDRCNTEIQNSKTKRKELQKTVDKLRKKIKPPFEGSTDELKIDLEEFPSKIKEKEEEKDSFEVQLRDLEKISKNKSSLLREVGKLEKEAETHEENVKKRDTEIRELALKYDFKGFEATKEIDANVYQNFIGLMQQKLKEISTEGECKKEAEMKLQKEIDKLKETQTEQKLIKQQNEQRMTEISQELKDIHAKLKCPTESSDCITVALKKSKDDLARTESSVDVDALTEEIIRHEAEKKGLDANIKKLDSEINQISEQLPAQTQLNDLTKQKEAKHDTINLLRSSQEKGIIGLLGEMPDDKDLHLRVNTYITDKTKSVKESESALIKLNAKLLSEEKEKKTTLAHLQQKETELTERQDEISSICDSDNFEDELNKVAKNINETQEVKGAHNLISKYIRELKKDEAACPLCHRGFDQVQEIKKLILELEEQLGKEQDIEKNQKKYEVLEEWKRIKITVGKLKDVEIPELEEKIKNIEDEVKKMEKSLEGRKDDLKNANIIISEIVQMDRHRDEMHELETEIAIQKAMITSSGSSRQMEDVISEREQKQLKLETVNGTLDSKRKEKSEFQDQVLSLKSKVDSLNENKLAIEGQLQATFQLENTKATLTADNVRCQKAIKDARVQLVALDKEIEMAEGDKAALSCQKEKAREEVDLLKNNEKSVNDLNKCIQSYLTSGKETQLVNMRKDQTQLELKQAEKDKVKEKIDSLKIEITRLEFKQNLCEKEEEIKKLDVSIEEHEKKLGVVDVKNFKEELKRKEKKRSDLDAKQHNEKGQQEILKEQIKEAMDKLGSYYKNADVNHNNKVIDNRTLEIANKDLDKYYKAMEAAIMRYHKCKLDEINRIILDLWRKTYQGNDIDTIEIRSEKGDSEGIQVRRNYNYRVVMIKNDIAIDMPGQCSAGQKVLTSIIIRLALAETFSTNCGILALDEPTTNLDRKNIDKLAKSLVEIIKVKVRHTVQHFQLIVITHDKYFIEVLGREDFISKFVHVKKNDDGLSQLEVKNLKDIGFYTD